MKGFPACQHVQNVHVWCLQRTEEVIVSPGTGVPVGYELPCGFWELNLDPEEKQQMFFTTEPSL